MPSPACLRTHLSLHSFPTRRSSDLSRRTHEDRLARLREAGVSEEEIARMRSPIGLDLGARTPEETAVSIAAELIQTRWGGSGRPLSRSEEHTSELQSRGHLVCRLLHASAPTCLYTLSLHDALPISAAEPTRTAWPGCAKPECPRRKSPGCVRPSASTWARARPRRPRSPSPPS